MRGPLLLVALALFAGCSPAAPRVRAWPAEPPERAVNLTALDRAFEIDLSGAVWDPVAERLWICRNGPLPDDSMIWALVPTGDGWMIEERGGRRCAWRGFGDVEGLTLVEYGSTTVYMITERDDMISSYDLSEPGTATRRASWPIGQWAPSRGGLGPEGITFVPNANLARALFTDGAGAPRTGRGGLGGLMLVAHQDGGRIHAFDLASTGGDALQVGVYDTPRGETAALEFDRATDRLYAYHDAEHRELSVLALTSHLSEFGTTRAFDVVHRFRGPGLANVEGVALRRRGAASGEVFLTVDNGGPQSLLWFREFVIVGTSR